MTPEISEFSYGFALTNEVVGWTTLTTAPIFPSLIEEGKAGGGYDVKFDMPGIPLYLQFKRADCMTRRTAHEVAKDKLRLDLPFFRFSITEAAKSNQHEMLLQLDDGANEVFYVAPRFYRLSEINRAWNAKEVAARSIFVRPVTIGLLDDDPHHISYDDRSAFLCSNPRPIEFVTAAALVESLTKRLETENEPLREALPRFNASLTEAWVRGLGRVAATLQPGDMQYGVVPLEAVAPLPPPEPHTQVRTVPIRDASPLSERPRQLRQLADNALRLFGTQLVIVQHK